MKKVTRMCLFAAGFLTAAGAFSLHYEKATAEEGCECGHEDNNPSKPCNPVPINTNGRKICSKRCLDFTLDSIPVGDFFPSGVLPVDLADSGKELQFGNGLSQGYNNGHDDGFCEYKNGNGDMVWADMLSEMCRKKQIVTDTDGKPAFCIHYLMNNYTDRDGKKLLDGNGNAQTVQAPITDKICDNNKPRWWQHSGIDIAVENGYREVKAVQPMLVVASQSWGDQELWGESIIGVTRANLHSEELVTYHYHHLKIESFTPYTPTRRFNACDTVKKRGEVLAVSGKTGNVTGAHLHLGVRYWKNLMQLKEAITSNKDAQHPNGTGAQLYGHGYGNGDNAKLHRNLDPLRLITDRFAELNKSDEYHKHAFEMRYLGLEFGEWDGSFGATIPVTRGESARWMSAALKQPIPHNYPPTLPFPLPMATFPDDVPVGSEFSNYVENLAHYPGTESIINRNITCEAGKKKFCPGIYRTRAEVWKMMVLGFYEPYFAQFAEGDWEAVAQPLLFGDVPLDRWYAQYVYFGVASTLIEEKPNFFPEKPIGRLEFAKWLMQGHEDLFGSSGNLCVDKVCPENFYCVPSTGTCKEFTDCISSENKDCPVGGGGPCTPNQTTGCGNCGTQTCGANGQWGNCVNQGVCSPGEPQTQTCNGSGTQTRTCQSNCQWGSWSTCQSGCACSSGVCCNGCQYSGSSTACNSWNVYQCQGSNPGQDAQYAQVTQYCSGGDSGCSGQISQSSWQTYDDCTSNEVCQQSGGSVSCVPGQPSCQDVYLIGGSSACYNNPQGSGNPTLCLEVEQLSGATWRYRVCKSTGTFGTYDYYLQDDNHSVQFSQYTGSGGSCSTWQNADLAYLPGYGPGNGAGLKMYMSSPAGCTQATCQYQTGGVTVYRQCQ